MKTTRMPRTSADTRTQTWQILGELLQQHASKNRSSSKSQQKAAAATATNCSSNSNGEAAAVL